MGVSIAGREVFNDTDINNPDIDGGTADNVTIGGSTPAVGTFTTVNATTFDTNVAEAGVTLSGTTLAADGTDSNIDINITPKGTGTVKPTTSITMPDAGKITWDIALASDHTCTGETFAAVAGENLVFGDNTYLKASDQRRYKVSATSTTTMPVGGSAMATDTISAGASGTFMKWGYARDDSAWAGMTVGSPLYSSLTAGALTQTAPSSDGNQIQPMGHATSLNSATVGMIFYCPGAVTEVGLDVVDFGTDHAVNITWAELSADPKTWQGDDAHDQTATITTQATAADIGKEFRLVKKGTGAGTMICQAPTNMLFVNSAGVSTATGTITSEASKYQSVHCKCISTTEILILCSDGTWTKSS